MLLLTMLALTFAHGPIGGSGYDGDFGPPGAPAVELPLGWVAADTHLHPLICNSTVTISTEVMLAQMSLAELQVGSALIWQGAMPLTEFLDDWVPLVDGNVISSADAVVKYDLEVGFEAGKTSGHLQALNLNHADFDVNNEYQTLNASAFKLQGPQVLTGYAHIGWPDDYSYPPMPAQQGKSYFLTHLGAIDAALGLVDFVETINVDPAYYVGIADEFPSLHTPYTGLYYKLLNAGLRPTLVGGTDWSCNSSVQNIGDVRTYALLDSATITYSAFTEAIAAGRTSVANGKSRFLRLQVEGQEAGSEIHLAQAGSSVDIDATIAVTPGADYTNTLEIVANGVVVQSQAFALNASNQWSETIHFDVTIDQSSWIIARTSHTHTSAAYVILQNRPIVVQQDATYWSSYCDHIIANLDQFTSVITQTAEITSDIQFAKKYFDAAASYASSDPTGVQRYGASTGSCRGPITLSAIKSPQAGDMTFGVYCMHAPPNTQGWLLISSDTTSTGSVPLLGSLLWLDLTKPLMIMPVQSTQAHVVEIDLPLPITSSGVTFNLQCLWQNTPQCSNGALLCSSNALHIQVQ